MNAILEHGKRYVVTKASDDETFEVGDHIWLTPSGDVMCKEGGGWIESEYALPALVGAEVRFDTEWLERQKRILREKLSALEKLEKSLEI